MPDLIAHADLATLCFLNSGVEARKTGAAIADVHLEMEKILGKTGYALVYANAPSFGSLSNSATYVTLLTTYIKPFMAWRVKQRATVDMWAEADKGGIYIKAGQDYNAVRGGELSKVEAAAQSRADAALERLLEYINNNLTVFTWFTTNVNSEERIDGKNKTSAGISFRRSARQDPYRG